MEKLLCTLLLIFNITLVSFGADKSKDKIIIKADEYYPPFTFVNSKGDNSGFAVELTDAIMAKLGLDYELELSAWYNVVNLFKKGEVDLIPTLQFSKDNNEYFWGAEHGKVSLNILCRKDNIIKSIDSLSNKVIAIQKNSASAESYRRLNIKSPKLIEVNSVEEIASLVNDGTADLAILSKDVARYIIVKDGYSDLEIINVGIPEITLGFGTHDKEFLNQIEGALDELKADGTYDRMYNKWLNYHKQRDYSKSLIVSIFCLLISIVIILILRRLSQRIKTNLFETKARYTAVFENTTVGIEYYDSNGILRDINEPCFRLLGFKGKKHEVLGEIQLFDNPILIKNVFSDNPNHDINQYISDIERLNGENNILKCDLRDNYKDKYFVLCEINKILYMETRLNLIYDKNHNVKAILCTYTDISNLINAQEALEVEKNKAQNDDMLKSKFLANMSHEIRTPLNAIVGFSELLASEDLADERDQFNNLIQDNSQLLLRLINDILDLSKLDAGVARFNYSDFDFVDMLSDLKLTLAQSLHNDDIEFTIKNSLSELTIHSDRQKLTQIIGNYVTNSFKYTEKGTVEISYEVEDPYLKIQVKDTGIGIADDKKDKVFMRFEKLDDYAKGTGLGLSICKAIAENMGGSVGFESTEGLGSTFWVRLPIK